MGNLKGTAYNRVKGRNNVTLDSSSKAPKKKEWSTDKKIFLWIVFWLTFYLVIFFWPGSPLRGR